MLQGFLAYDRGRLRVSVRMRRIGALLAATLTVVAVSCGSSTEEKERAIELKGECTLNSDCQDELVCVFGRCHEECAASEDCPRQSRCVRSESEGIHVCQFDDETNCELTRDCEGDQVCAIDGECRDECEKESECAEAQQCLEGVCADEEELVDGELPNKSEGAGGAGGQSGSSQGGAAGQGGSSQGGSSAGGAAGSDTGAGGSQSTFDCSVCSDTQSCEFDRCYDQCDALNECDDSQTCCTVNGEGICVDTDSDVNNCGGCGNVCGEDSATEFACSSGACEVQGCEAPYEDCDGNPENGCEADPTSDPKHCGTCANACGVGAECNDGECEEGLSMIAAGSNATCLVRDNGKTLCWGQIVPGTPGRSPQVIPGVEDPVGLEVALGGTRVYAVTSEGRVLSFGTSPDEQETPVVEPITQVTQVNSGNSTTCALRTNNLVSCWGQNNYGQLGDGSTDPSDDPVQVSGLEAVDLAVGNAFACAIRTDDTGACWGYNGYGQLGDGTNGNTSAPTDVSLVTDFVQIVAGQTHTCGLRANGDVMCWGDNSWGQSGVENGESRYTEPTLVEGLEDVESLHTGYGHTCALHTDATISCWGYNNAGQLGDNTTENRARPERVPGITDVVSVALGQAHTCVLRDEGPPLCWGANNSGQLGDGSTSPRMMPVQVANLP